MLFDLDGTILQNGVYVSERVLKALREAREAGFVLAVCSGRPICMINSALRDGHVMDYFVCSNGASILDADCVSLLRRPMSRELALRNVSLLSDLSPAWNMFTGPKAYRERRGNSYMMARSAKVFAQAQGIKDRAALLANIVRMQRSTHFRAVGSISPKIRHAADGIEKMGCNVRDLDEARTRLEATGELEVAAMSYGELEITGKGVTKGTGVDELGRMLGIPKDRRIAFGDGGNDLPMAVAVGRFVAMGNATDEVKQQATDECDTVENDGVATWIERELL